MDGVGDDPRLRARERDGLVAEVVHGHGDERTGDALARREQHVELARVRLGRDLARELEQPVGRVAHRRDGRDDADAALARVDEAPGDVLILSGSATDEPPNFMTTVSEIGSGRGAHGTIVAVPAVTRPLAAALQSGARASAATSRR